MGAGDATGVEGESSNDLLEYVAPEYGSNCDLPEDAALEVEGVRALHGLTVATGYAAVRVVFGHILRRSPLGGRALARVSAAVAAAVARGPSEVGCMRVDFWDATTRAPGVAHLLVGECARDHDLGAQLDKLKTRVAADKWPEVLKHASALVCFARAVYANFATANVALIREALALPTDAACAQFLALRVDHANTTLFVDESWPERVGLYVA